MTQKNLSAKARIRIRRPPKEVFDAFADADKMSKFWFTRRDVRLTEGKTSTWFLGPDPDAYSFDVQVQELREPEKIALTWEGSEGHSTQVTWELAEAENGDTILTIEESGFDGDRESIVAQVLDSTRGFNQAIVAAKALIEHGIELNVVADHA